MNKDQYLFYENKNLSEKVDMTQTWALTESHGNGWKKSLSHLQSKVRYCVSRLTGAAPIKGEQEHGSRRQTWLQQKWSEAYNEKNKDISIGQQGRNCHEFRPHSEF